MNKYTLEDLKALNYSYDSDYSITEAEVEKVNLYIEKITSTRTEEKPQIGDMVQFTSEHGDYYNQAHIEQVNENGLYICEQPSAPFCTLYKNGTELATDTSGGAWTTIPKNIEYVGMEIKQFKVWGRFGACANGAVYFNVPVSVWTHSMNKGDYSTKTHDKFMLMIGEQEYASDYKYFIRKDTYNHMAFYTLEEYHAWLKTFNGVEVPGAWDNMKVVWTYKQTTECVPLDEYLEIKDAIIDSTLCNGYIQECKRIIEGTSIHTVMPYQHEKIELEGEKCFRNASTSK